MFFALGAEDAVDRIGRAAGGFVVVAHLHFAEQANRQHIESRQQQDGSKNHEWAVIGHYVRMAEELFNHQPERNSGTGEDAQHPH